jgi:hypothetical protein
MSDPKDPPVMGKDFEDSMQSLIKALEGSLFISNPKHHTVLTEMSGIRKQLESSDTIDAMRYAAKAFKDKEIMRKMMGEMGDWGEIDPEIDPLNEPDFLEHLKTL